MFLSKRPNGIYYIYYEGSNGKRTRKTTKCTLKKNALEYLSKFSEKLKAEKEREFIPISLKEFSFEYLKYSESYHTWKTTLTYKTTFNAILKYYGNIQLVELDRKRIEEYIQYKIRNVSIYCARKDIINIKASLNWGVDNGYLINNSSQSIKRIKPPERLPLYFSKNEFNKLMDSIEDNDLKDLVLFAVNTGLRQGELINLRFNQINLKTKSLILNNQDFITKNKKVRTIPLNQTCYNIILNRIKNSNTEDIVFTLNGNQINQDYIIHKFKSYVLKAGINPKYHFHTLRHTFASRLVQSGISIYTVQKLMGHADTKTTAIYANLRDENLKSAVDHK